MQKIQENEINWIKEKEPQSQEVLNRPQKELLSKLGTQPFQDITQEMGNDENKVISQAQVQREILNILQRISEINTILNNKNVMGYGNGETRTNEQNDDLFIRGGSILQDLNGNSTTDVVSQKAVTDYVQAKKAQQQTLTQGNGVNISNREISLQPTGNLSLGIDGKINKIDTTYTSGKGVNVNSNDKKISLNVGQGLEIKNNRLSVKDNYINYEDIDGQPIIPEKFGLGFDGQKYKNVTTGVNGTRQNNNNYPIYVYQYRNNNGGNVFISVNNIEFKNYVHQGGVGTIVPPLTSYTVSGQHKLIILEI